MKNYLMAALLAVVALVAPACSSISKERADSLRETARQERDEGNLTQSQYEVLIDQINRLESGEGLDWPRIGQIAGEVGLSVVGAVTGVRLLRGPAKPVPKDDAPLLRELVAAERERRKKPAGEASPPT